MSSNGTIFLQDNFNRSQVVANGNSWDILKKMPDLSISGSSWAPHPTAAIWGITTGFLYAISDLGGGYYCLIDSKKSDNFQVEYSLKASYSGNATNYIYPRFIFRNSDTTSNGYCLYIIVNGNSINLNEVINGTTNTIASLSSLTIPNNDQSADQPHNIKIIVQGEKITVYLGISGATPTLRLTAYSSWNINKTAMGFVNTQNTTFTGSFCYVSNFKVTSIADIDNPVIFSDSFNRATTTAIGTTSPDIGSPYTQVAGNFGITTGYRGYSSDDVNANANIYKDIYPNSNNFRWEFDQVFRPLVNALSTGRLFRPVFRYCNNDGSAGASTSYLWFALNSVGPILYYRTPQNSDTTVISAVGVTTLTAGTNYHFVVTVQNDNISLNLNGATIINQSGVTFNSKLMGNENPITMSRVGFIYTKASSEVSTYNTYLDNFTIYDLGANTAILGDDATPTDVQYKAKGLTITDTQSATDSKYKTFGITRIDINLTPIEYSVSKGISLTSISDTEILSDTNKVVRGWIFNNSASMIDGNYEKINNKEIVYLIGGKPIKINQTINKQISSNTEIEQIIYITAQIISNKNN
jgi:hypothetical protein